MTHDPLTPGDGVVFTAVVTDQAGNPISTGVTLSVRAPGSDTITDLTNDLSYDAPTNTWSADYVLADAGIYYYRWASTGAAPGAFEGILSVAVSRV